MSAPLYEVLEMLENVVAFAYEHGYHEHGSPLVREVRQHIATLQADADRLEWCERHMQEASVFDPPSGDAWVWELRYVLPGDADDLTTRSTQGHAYFRAAIDDAMTDAAEAAS